MAGSKEKVVLPSKRSVLQLFYSSLLPAILGFDLLKCIRWLEFLVNVGAWFQFFHRCHTAMKTFVCRLFLPAKEPATEQATTILPSENYRACLAPKHEDKEKDQNRLEPEEMVQELHGEVRCLEMDPNNGDSNTMQDHFMSGKRKSSFQQPRRTETKSGTRKIKLLQKTIFRLRKRVQQMGRKASKASNKL